MTVKEYPLESVQISELQFDHSNPNQLTKKQKVALQNVMKKFGFLVPIIIDNERHIIDGEHRAEAYAQLGYSIIPAFIIDTTKEDYEKKFLRQWLNKFHGVPDPDKDIEELEYIMQDETGAAMLDELLDIDYETLDDMNKGMDEESGGTGEDKDDQADKMRKIVLYFTKIEYPDIKEKFDRLKEEYSVTTETEVVKLLIEHKESSI